MHENDVARDVVQPGFEVHIELGPRLLESACHAVLDNELLKSRYAVDFQPTLPLVDMRVPA